MNFMLFGIQESMNTIKMSLSHLTKPPGIISAIFHLTLEKSILLKILLMPWKYQKNCGLMKGIK